MNSSERDYQQPIDLPEKFYTNKQPDTYEFLTEKYGINRAKIEKVVYVRRSN